MEARVKSFSIPCDVEERDRTLKFCSSFRDVEEPVDCHHFQASKSFRDVEARVKRQGFRFYVMEERDRTLKSRTLFRGFKERLGFQHCLVRDSFCA